MMYAFFIIAWGLNYQRLPLQTSSEGSDPETLRAQCLVWAQEANTLRSSIYPQDAQTIFDMIPSAFDQAQNVYPALPGPPPSPPKASGFDDLMTAWMIEGIYIPFTFEALVNTNVPWMDLPFIACHEAAHSIGLAREEEANLAAYWVCSESEESLFRYSGALNALRYVLPALANMDPSGYWQCYNALSASVRYDIAARDAYWLTARNHWTATVSGRMNDGYLSYAAQQPEGIRTYEKMLDLLLQNNR